METSSLMHLMRYNMFAQLLEMLLENPDVFQVMSCGIGQEYT